MTILRRRRYRTWTPLDLILLIAGLLVIALGLAFSQQPPLPPGATLTARVSFELGPEHLNFHAYDTNGNPQPLTLRVRGATNITGPFSEWPVMATLNWTNAPADEPVLTNRTVVVLVTNLTGNNWFFAATSSNFFSGESAPSRVISIPHDPPTNLRLLLEP